MKNNHVLFAMALLAALCAMAPFTSAQAVATTAWTSQSNTLSNTTYADSCVTVNNYIYCMSSTSIALFPTVQYAQVLPGGGTAAWTSQSNTLAVATDYMSCVTANNYIYCMGNSVYPGPYDVVQYAQVLPGGGTTAWQTTNSLAVGGWGLSCVAANNYIYCMGGAYGPPVVQYASILPNGGTSTWTSQSNNLAVGEFRFSCITANNYIYCMGGGSETSVVQYTSISSGVGPTGAWTSQSNTLAVGEWGHSCVTANNAIYCMGGSPSASNVQYSSITSAGNPTSAWTSQSSNTLSVGEYDHSCVTANNYIYCLGGSFSPYNEVQYAYALTPTTTVLNSSQDPSMHGASVTFTATVTSSSGTPTGTVTFYDGATPIGAVALTGGVATLAPSALSIATHSIFATYSGSANYGGSTSSATSQVVVQIPTISITPSSNSIDIGQAITYTANIPSGAGVGPFTVNLVYTGNVVSTNTIPDAGGNSITLSYTPTVLGQLTFNAIATDTGIAPAYVFNSISNVITVNSFIPNSTYNFVVSVPSNTETNITYSKANATLSITSSNNVNTNVIISNVTSNYTSTPFVSYTHFSKVVLLNLTMTNSTPSTMVYALTMGIPCGSNAAPYKLIGSSWHLLNYSSNTAACTISFNVPADPVIGLFTSVYTPPPSGGGGYAPSGGGPSGPSLTQRTQNGAACYHVANFTTPNYEHFTLNGTAFAVTVSTIAPNSTDLIINGITYVLKLNSSTVLFKDSNFNYAADVTGISYIPIEHTITVDVCAMAIPTVTNQTNNTTHSTTTIPENTTTNTPTTTIVPNPSNTSNAPVNASTTNTPAPASAAVPPASSNTYVVAAIVVILAMVAFLTSRRISSGNKKSEDPPQQPL